MQWIRYIEQKSLSWQALDVTFRINGSATSKALKSTSILSDSKIINKY